MLVCGDVVVVVVGGHCLMWAVHWGFCPMTLSSSEIYKMVTAKKGVTGGKTEGAEGEGAVPTGTSTASASTGSSLRPSQGQALDLSEPSPASGSGEKKKGCC